MQSQIDPSLPEETSGPKIGKVLIARLRAQLGIARDESSAHGTAIEGLTQSVANKADASTLDSYYSKTQSDARYPVLVGGVVPASNLPGYVDDVIEFANFAAFPVTGESGKMFVAIDTGKIYRWGGSAYVEISPSPGSTDAVVEGVNNLYFTAARVRAAILTGIDFSINAVVTAADSVLGALGKLQKQFTDHFADAKGHMSVAQKAKPGITGFFATDNNNNFINPTGLISIKHQVAAVLRQSYLAARARNPQLLPADNSLATVSSSSTAPSLTNKLTLPLQQNSLANFLSLVSTEGGWPVNAYSASLQVLAGHNNPGAAGANWTDSVNGAFASSWRVSFITNDQNPVLVYNKGANSYRPRVLIDDQYVSLTGHAPQGASAGLEYLTLALPSVKTRKITLELQLDQFFNRIIVANDSICVPAPSKPLTMFVLGDSYTYGPGIGAGVASDQATVFLGQGLYRVAADWLGIDCINSGIGGTGYIAGSYKYDDRWGDVLNTNWDILLIHGSINDGYASSTPVADVLAAASALINKAVAAYPDKPIIVTGVYPAAGSNLTRMQQIDAGLASLVSTLNSSRVKFISCINNIPTWTAGNALIASDNAHLQPVTGHAAMGRKLAAEIYNAVLSMS